MNGKVSNLIATGSPTWTKPSSRPEMFASTSSGASAGTSVMNCWPDCSTEPTETLATVSTVASRSARSSTSCLRNCALFSDSRASDSLLAASASFSEMSACQDCT